MATVPKIPTFDPQAITAAQAALAGAPASADAPGVDKIRELLFGNQMQDYDKRFSLLDDRFQQKLRDIEAESAPTGRVSTVAFRHGKTARVASVRSVTGRSTSKPYSASSRNTATRDGLCSSGNAA